MLLKLLNINLNDRVIGLDVMRSTAILIVVFGHYINFFNQHLSGVIPFTQTSLREFFDLLVTGFDGVDLFFVLSGFLIGHSLLKTFSQNKLNFNYLVNNFWIKRWFRTLPNYFFMLVLLIPVYYLVPVVAEGTGPKIALFKYFLFIQNFFKGEIAFFPESWSLSIEEWFYILFPIVLTITALVFSKQASKKNNLLVCIFSYIFFGLVIRLFYTNTHVIHDFDDWNRTIRTSVVMRFDAIIYGVLMAYFKMYYSVFFEKQKYFFLITGLFILSVSFKLTFINNLFSFAYSFHYSLVGIGMAFLIPYFYYLKLKRSFFIQMFTFISVVSYSVYLVNYSFAQVLTNHLISDGNIYKCIFKISTATFITLVLSIFLFKCIESPFMNLRRKVIHNNKRNEVEIIDTE